MQTSVIVTPTELNPQNASLHLAAQDEDEEEKKNGHILIKLHHTLDTALYDLPLTLKTYVPLYWKNVSFHQANKTTKLKILKDEKGKYVLFQALPNKGQIDLSGE